MAGSCIGQFNPAAVIGAFYLEEIDFRIYCKWGKKIILM
jgi:hypothetical protein